MPNLVKLYTCNGAMMVDTSELHNRMTTGSTRCLHIYNLRGNRIVDTAAYLRASPVTRPAGIVHPANLFASIELAEANRERIYADMHTRSLKENALSGAKGKIMFKIEVVSYKTDEVVKSIECSSLRNADKTESGIRINLNFEDYFTRIVDDNGNEV